MILIDINIGINCRVEFHLTVIIAVIIINNKFIYHNKLINILNIYHHD